MTRQVSSIEVTPAAIYIKNTAAMARLLGELRASNLSHPGDASPIFMIGGTRCRDFELLSVQYDSTIDRFDLIFAEPFHGREVAVARAILVVAYQGRQVVAKAYATAQQTDTMTALHEALSSHLAPNRS